MLPSCCELTTFTKGESPTVTEVTSSTMDGLFMVCKEAELQHIESLAKNHNVSKLLI